MLARAEGDRVVGRHEKKDRNSLLPLEFRASLRVEVREITCCVI